MMSYWLISGTLILDETGWLRILFTKGDMELFELTNDNHLILLVSALACVSKISLLTSTNNSMLVMREVSQSYK